MPASSSAVGRAVSRSLSALPIALSSKVPGNWKPCSGLSDWMSMGPIMGTLAPPPNSPSACTLPGCADRAVVACAPAARGQRLLGPPHQQFVPQALEEAALLHRRQRNQRRGGHHLAVQRDLHRAELLALGDR